MEKKKRNRADDAATAAALADAGLRVPEILLPRADRCDYAKWSVVACDQFTSQPSYWEAVEATVGGDLSTLRLVLPEAFLGDRFHDRVGAIHAAMREYISDGIFDAPVHGFILTERAFEPYVDSDGGARICPPRWGLVAALDLEAYDFEPGSGALIRASEATVRERLPARVDIRRGAALELPHVLVLADDAAYALIEPLAERAAAGAYKKLYDVGLMAGGGHLRGYLIEGAELAAAARAVGGLLQTARREAPAKPMLFAVGDGNHSLAAAKVFWNEIRGSARSHCSVQAEHPARYALVELVNLRSDGIRFEPIHRALYNVSGAAVIDAARRFFGGRGFSVEYGTVGGTAAAISPKTGTCVPASAAGFTFPMFYGRDKTAILRVGNPETRLPVAELQNFLDDFLAAAAEAAQAGATRAGAGLDYIHGMDELTRLWREEDCVCFALPPIDKSGLFPTITRDGVLPRKAFSMGEAREKRYYLEARKIIE